MWYIHDGAPEHFSHAVWDVLSNTYHDRWIGRGGHTAWPPCFMPDLNPSDFYLWGHLKALVNNRGISPLHCGCLSDYSKLPWNLWMDAVVHDETCPCALDLMEGILSTYYKCTPTAVTCKFNVSGHMLIWHFFSYWYVEHLPKICSHLSVTPCVSMYICVWTIGLLNSFFSILL
jgi:hypothetical protein